MADLKKEFEAVAKDVHKLRNGTFVDEHGLPVPVGPEKGTPVMEMTAITGTHPLFGRFIESGDDVLTQNIGE